MTTNMRFMRRAFTLLLLSYLGLTGVLLLIKPLESTTELRVLTRLPTIPDTVLDGEKLQRFFIQAEHYATDRMYFRQFYITQLNTLRVAAGVSPKKLVTTGKDGWLFLAGDTETEDARGSSVFSPSELDNWLRYLMHRSEEAKKHGAAYLFVVIPNKSTVYPEYLPNHITRLTQTKRLAQLSAALAKTGILYLDASDALIAAKKNGQLYMKSDTHWNLLGANYVQLQILQKLSEKLDYLQPQLYPFHPATPDEITILNPTSDLAHSMGLDLETHEKINYVVDGVGTCTQAQNTKGLRPWPVAIGDCSQKTPSTLEKFWPDMHPGQRANMFRATDNPYGRGTLLMMHDSFFEMLQPFFSNTFSHVDYILRDRPMDMATWDILLRETKPDVIIEEIIERRLNALMPIPGKNFPENFKTGFPETPVNF